MPSGFISAEASSSRRSWSRASCLVPSRPLTPGWPGISRSQSIAITFLMKSSASSGYMSMKPRPGTDPTGIVSTMNTIPVGSVPGRGFIDMYPLEAEDFIKKVIAMDWDRLIPGHPGVNGRLGTKQDARDQLRLLEEASAEMKPLGIAGKCWAAEKDLKLSSFKDWPGYQQGLEFIGRRYCGVWGRGT